MIRLLLAALLLHFFIPVLITPKAFAQIEMGLDDIIVIDPALCRITDFAPPEPIPTVCQIHAERNETRGFLSGFGPWCVIAMEGKSEAAIRQECQQPTDE